MSELPTIDLPPVVVPATVEKVYDIPWITEYRVFSDDPQNTRLYAIVRPSCVLPNGTREILVKDGTEQVVDIQDLFGILSGAKQEPKITSSTLQLGGQLMGLTIMFIKAYLTDKRTPELPASDIEPTADPSLPADSQPAPLPPEA